jgi:nucleoside-diphosphate-sugar epimerase
VNVLVTGGAGFLGQQFIARVLSTASVSLDGHAQAVTSVTCFDQGAGAIADARVRNVAGDIADAALLRTLVGKDTGVVVHLAAVVSGTAEADFDLGMRVNLDGTRALLEACRAAGHRPRLLFSSSIAAFGGDLPEVVTDALTPAPQGSYGAQKVIGEYLVSDYSRKGYVDGRSVRVPTVVVRPGKPNGAASGFASGIIREPLAGVDAVLPVDPSTAMWVASPRAVIGMFLHAIDLPESAWGWNRVLNLPGLVVTMQQELEALRRVAGDAVLARVSHNPDAAIERLVRTWAGRFDTVRARSMGFVCDRDFDAIVRAYIEDNPGAVRA